MRNNIQKTVPAFLALLICCVAGCNIDQGAWVFVDNGSTSPMIVEIDGEHVASIAPGSFERVSASLGEHQFKVTSNGRTLFEGTKNIEAGESLMRPRRYMFNPDSTNRYFMYKVFYYMEGTDFDDDYLDNEEDYAQNYRDLCSEFELLPAGDWFEIPNHPYVLTPAPDEIEDRDGLPVTEKQVMARLTISAYNVLKQAKTNTRPSEDELYDLEDAYMSHVIDF